MNERLKRELNKTFLVLDSEGYRYEETYEIEMLVKNSLEKILPLHVLRMNGNLELYYDISAKQTLKSCVERQKMSADTIRKLFQEIDEMLKEVKAYMLNAENILLDLGHIYTKDGTFYFCYCPWENQDLLTSFRKLLEEILGELDYHDTAGVELAYHLYQKACKGEFCIADILEEHVSEKEEDFRGREYERYFADQEEITEEFLQESEPKQEEKPKKPGIRRRILEFFLKKQEPEQPEQETYLSSHEELYQEYFSEGSSGIDYTQILESTNTNTVLLENMPVGFWKLRPLLPGYEEFCITGESFLVGKKRDSVDGLINRDTISRIHSRLHVKQERLYIADANSTNGTFVNGVPIEPGVDVEICPGDRILFADVGYECYNSL